MPWQRRRTDNRNDADDEPGLVAGYPGIVATTGPPDVPIPPLGPLVHFYDHVRRAMFVAYLYA